MKAMTLPPENAALVAAGVQTIITTARQPRLTAGDRLAIHAGTRLPKDHGVALGDWMPDRVRGWGWIVYNLSDAGNHFRLHPGHIVASAVVRDVVPILVGDEYDDRHHLCIDNSPDNQGGLCRVWKHGYENISDQLPLADFTPGRWAVLLDDVAPTTDRCPACWGTKGTSGCIPYEVARWRTPCPTCDGAGTCWPIPWRGGAGVWRWEP